MDFTYIIFIFCLFGECFWLSKEEIFYNPFKTELESNLVDFKILYQSENAKYILASRTQELEVINDFVKFPHNAYLLSQSIFVFTDELNNNYLFLEDGYYYFKISSDNEIETHQSKTSLSSDVLNIKFKDYIKLTKKSFYSKTENISIYYYRMIFYVFIIIFAGFKNVKLFFLEKLNNLSIFISD